MRGYCSELHMIKGDAGGWRIRHLAIGYDDAWSVEVYPTLTAAEREVDERNRARRKAANLCLRCIMNPQPARLGHDSCSACAFSLVTGEAEETETAER